jgi:phosphoglycolate phosphatase-like HAD superfamily hydrolase
VKLIAFDLDGVLYSSEPFLGEAYREAIAEVNRRRPGSFARVPSTREILDHVGWPVAEILARLFPAVERAAVDLLYDVTLEVISRRVAQREGILYDAVAPTLSELARRGHRLAVASNGRGRYIEAVLATYGIAALFADRITADQVGDKESVLRAYLARYEVAPGRALMVGDRASDVAAARALAVPFIGCDYGHGYRHEIEGAGPIISRFDALLTMVM